MRYPVKFILWILPVLGFVLGYTCAYVFFHGLLETWHFVGKPDENIVRILGIRDARKLLVATQTGKIFSFEFGKISFNGFSYEGEVTLPIQPVWEKMEHDTVDPVRRLEYYGADFFTWPPFFQAAQMYEAAYLYDYEGKGEVKFALADDGNLWIWNHQIDGMTGVVFYFYPAMGFLTGLAIVLIIIGVNWLEGKHRST
jgi:hypothetical protein